MPSVHDLRRIEDALDAASVALKKFTPGEISSTVKRGGDPLTEADTAVNRVLLETLPAADEGWLSEESADSTDRLSRERTWIVDPIDGTREFIEGIPEWCVSIGLVENGHAVAGGILSPSTNHRIVGAVGFGVTLNGVSIETPDTTSVNGALVLASRSEVARGEWDGFFTSPISVRNLGSVAYKLGLVAAGLADATWTLVPKHEWDVAGGAALIAASGGDTWLLDGRRPLFNRPNPKLDGFIAARRGLGQDLLDLISDHSSTSPI
jgi:myo-inositol-1(or 4)-monophosphatase